MRMAWLACLAVAGCGRFGFDPRADACTGDDCPDAAVNPGADASGSDGGSGGDDGGGTDGDGGSLVSVAAAADTAINSFAPTFNYGGATAFNVRDGNPSTYVGLVRFDVSTVSGTVQTATMHLTTDAAFLTGGAIVVYPILEPWQEGSQLGSAGAASWNQRTPGVNWTAAGCGSGSRVDVEVGRFVPADANTDYAVSLQPSLVQTWVDNPIANLGVALVAENLGPGDAVGFWARENGADGPRLEIELAP